MIKLKQPFNFFLFSGKSAGIFLVRNVLLYLLLPFLMVACDKMNIFYRPYVATVNGSKIYLDEYQSLLEKKIHMVPREYWTQPDYLRRFEKEVLDALIVEKIMYLRAQELNISVSEAELEKKIQEIKKDYGEDFINLFKQENIDYEKWKKEFGKEILLQKLIDADVNARIKISEEEIEDYFKKNRSRYKSDARVRVSQIVVQDMAKANKAMERLNAGEDFGRVAADVSIGPEAARGGDLGFITKLIMPEPLDKTIFQMPVDEISPIVQSSYGFHIFKITEIQPARDRNLIDVREDVLTDIRLQKEDEAFIVWLNNLKKKAVIKKATGIKIKKYFK